MKSWILTSQIVKSAYESRNGEYDEKKVCLLSAPMFVEPVSIEALKKAGQKEIVLSRAIEPASESGNL